MSYNLIYYPIKLLFNQDGGSKSNYHTTLIYEYQRDQKEDMTRILAA